MTPTARRKVPKILVIDDDAAMREVLNMRLGPWGYEVSLAASGEEAQRLALKIQPDLVISDITLPDLSGLDLLRWIHERQPSCPIILITAYGSIDAAVEAMREGARDFLTKPIDYPKLRRILLEAQQDNEQRQAASLLEQQLESEARLGPMIGQSRPMRKLFKMIRLLGENEASAIVTGESGTGKELVAQTIHQLSRRQKGPFVAINTAAIAEGITESELFGHEKGAFTGALATHPGCFEQAADGTLFLDEFAEMPLHLQPKFLRVLEECKVRRLGGAREVAFDVRVLAATNRDPVREVEEGRLRRDLFFRLNVFTIHLPPLRDRRDDLPLLAQHFVLQFNKKHRTEVDGVSAEALERLADYSWPGNVRELRNVMERAVILARKKWIEPVHLPEHIAKARGGLRSELVLPPAVTFAEAERILILETLKRAANNKAEAARQLGLDVKTIRNKLKLYAQNGEDEL